MAVDALLQFLLEEVAMDGDAGTSLESLARFVADFYARSASSSGTADDGRLQLVDDAFLSFVWDTLVAEPDVRLGVLTAIKGEPDDAPGTPQAGPSSAAGTPASGDNEDGDEAVSKKKKKPGKRAKIERKAQGPTHEMRILGHDERAEGREALQAKYGADLRILAGEETAWVAITGSHARISSVTPPIYAVLQHISRGREMGTTAVRISKELGIEPKSVFHYIKVPQQLGIVKKFSDIDEGCRTNRVVHVRYLDRSEAWKAHIASEPDAIKDEDGDDNAEPDADGAEWSGLEMTPISSTYLSSNVPLIRARIVKAIKRREGAWMPHIELHSSIGLHAMDHSAMRRLNTIVTQLASEGLVEKVTFVRKKAGGKSTLAQAIRLCAPRKLDEELETPARGKRREEEDDDDGAYPSAGRPVERQVLDLLMDADARGLTIAEISTALGRFSPRFIESMLQRLARVAPPAHLADYLVHSTQETVGRVKQARWFSLVGYLSFRRARGFPDDALEAAYAAHAASGRIGAFETLEGDAPAEGQYAARRDWQKKVDGFYVWAVTGAQAATNERGGGAPKKRGRPLGSKDKPRAVPPPGPATAKPKDVKGKGKAADQDAGAGEGAGDGDGDGAAKGEDNSSPAPPPPVRPRGRPRKIPLKPGEESPYMRRKREKAEDEERAAQGLPPIDRKKLKRAPAKRAKRTEEVAKGEGAEAAMDVDAEAGPSSAAAGPSSPTMAAAGPSNAAADDAEPPAPQKKRARAKKGTEVAARTPATTAEPSPASASLETPAPSQLAAATAAPVPASAAMPPSAPAATPAKKRPRASSGYEPATANASAIRPCGLGRLEPYVEIEVSPARKRVNVNMARTAQQAVADPSEPSPVCPAGETMGKVPEAGPAPQAIVADQEDEVLPSVSALHGTPAGTSVPQDGGPVVEAGPSNEGATPTQATPAPAATPALARVADTNALTPCRTARTPIVRQATPASSRKTGMPKKSSRQSAVSQSNLTMIERQNDIVEYVKAQGGIIEHVYHLKDAIQRFLKERRPEAHTMDRYVLIEALESCVAREILRKTSAVGSKGERHDVYYLPSIPPDSPELGQFLRNLVVPVVPPTRAQRFTTLELATDLVVDEAFDVADAVEDKPTAMLADPVPTDSPETVRQFFSQQPLVVGRSHGVRQGLAARARQMHKWLASWLFRHVDDADVVVQPDEQGYVVAQKTILEQMPVGIFVRLVPLPIESETLDAYLADANNRDTPMSAAPRDILAIIRPQHPKRKAAMWKNFETLLFLRLLAPLVPHYANKGEFASSRVPKQATHWRFATTVPLYALRGDKSLIDVCKLDSNDAVAAYWVALQEACCPADKDMQRIAIEDERFPAKCATGMYVVRNGLTKPIRWRDTYQLAQLQRNFLFLLVKHDAELATNPEARAQDIEQWARALFAPVETVKTYLVAAHEKAIKAAATVPGGRGRRKKLKIVEDGEGEADEEDEEAAARRALAATALHRKVQDAAQQRERDWHGILERFRGEHGQPELDHITLEWLHGAFLDPRRQMDAKHLDAELRRLLPKPASSDQPAPAPVESSFKTIVPLGVQRKARLAADPYAIKYEPDLRKRTRKYKDKATAATRGAVPEQQEQLVFDERIRTAQSGTSADFLSVPLPPHPQLEHGRRLPRDHYSAEQDELILDAYAVLRARSQHLNARIQFAAFEPFFPGSKPASIRQRALTVLRKPSEQEYHDRLTAAYLARYLAEGADIPDPYPNSVLAFDLPACIRFLRDKVNKSELRLMRSVPQPVHIPIVTLPSTLEQLNAQYSIALTESATAFPRRFDKVWAKYHISTNVRDEAVAAVPLAKTFAPKDVVEPVERVKELTRGAIQAVLAVAEHRYDESQTDALLAPFDPLIPPLVEELSAKHIMYSASSEMRAIPGRAVSYNSKFFHRFDAALTLPRLREAADFEKELHAEGESVFPLVPTDGDMMAFLHLVSEGKVEVSIDTGGLSGKALDYGDFVTRQANDDDIECGVHLMPTAPLEATVMPQPETLLREDLTWDEAALAQAVADLPPDAGLARTVELCIAAAGAAGSQLPFLASVAGPAAVSELPRAIALLTESSPPLAFFAGTDSLALVHARHVAEWTLPLHGASDAARRFLPTLWTGVDGTVNVQYWTRACTWVKSELWSRSGMSCPALVDRAAQRQILTAHEVRTILVTLHKAGKVTRVEGDEGAVDWERDHWALAGSLW